MTFFSFLPFSFFLTLFLSSLSQRLQNAEYNPNTKTIFLINQMKSKKEKKRKERDLFMSKRINSISINWMLKLSWNGSLVSIALTRPIPILFSSPIVGT